MGLSVSLHERESVVCVKLAGKVRVEAAASLLEQLAGGEKSKDFSLDWEDAEHVDASVLQVLLALKKSLDATGHSLSVERDNAQVREYLRLSGLTEHFPPLPAQSSNENQESHA